VTAADVNYLLDHWRDVYRKSSESYQKSSLQKLPPGYRLPLASASGFYSNNDIIFLHQTARNYGFAWEDAVKTALYEARITLVNQTLVVF